ncbi:MAG: ABC transporter ATP-binding protein [Candidatus Dormiibacterota bacterium]
MAAGTAPAIATQKVTKRFGKLTAVNELTIEVLAGQVVGFLGPNGAGKTTAMRMLMGFIRPTSGRATILGGQPARDVALRRQIGYLPGDFRMDSAMSGRDLFAWFGHLRGGLNRARVNDLTDRLRLDASRPYRDLSKGNRQKIGLVQAFMHDPQVLILDEPTTGLDPLIQKEFLGLVREAAERGAAVLFSTHVLPEVERIADAVAIIRAGRLVALSPVNDLLDRARHRLEFRFSAPITKSLFDGVPGVVEVEVNGQTATIAVDGPVDKAVRAALNGPTLIRVGSAGDELEDLFLTMYGSGQETV